MSEKKFEFLILALNEEKLLKKTFVELMEVINELNLQNYSINIVDDGSTDNTYKVACEIKEKLLNGLNIIKNDRNFGISLTVKKFIQNYKYDGKLFVISGDNDIHKSLIKKMILASFKSDLVISFFLNRERKGRFRAFLSTLFNLISCTLFNVYCYYLQGPVVWPISIVKKIDFRTAGISYVTEVNIKLLRSDIIFSEVSGLMNTGSINSTSLKFNNFFDIFCTFIKLFFEIIILKKYNHKATRIIN